MFGNTMGDCYEDESGICSIKTNNLNGRKHRWHSTWKWTLPYGVYLVVYIKEKEFIPKCIY